MALITFKVLVAFGFPLALQCGGRQILPHASDRAAAINPPRAKTQALLKALNPCWLGSGLDAGKRCWSWLNEAARQAAEKFPTIDVLFPFVYGGTLALNLWWVWETLGHPFYPAWIVAPLAMILTADWTEHLLQLAQLSHSVSSNKSRARNLWIEISGCATTITLWLTLGLYISLMELVAKLMVMLSRRRTAGHDSARLIDRRGWATERLRIGRKVDPAASPNQRFHQTNRPSSSCAVYLLR